MRVQGLRKMDPHTQEAAAAAQKPVAAQEAAAAAATKERAEREALRQKVLAAAPCHYGPPLKLPPQCRLPPPPHCPGNLLPSS